MDIPLSLERRLDYKPTAWSVGYCSFCKLYSPAIQEKEFDVLAVHGGKPELFRLFLREVFRCDFCQRFITPSVSNIINLDCWTPMDGIPKLTEQLGILYSEESFSVNSSTRLHSILIAATQSYSPSIMDTVGGIGLGVMAGFVSGGALGLILNIIRGAIFGVDLRNQFTEVLIGVIAGPVIGGVIGGIWHYLFERNKRAFAFLFRIYQQYEIDLDQLCDCSASHRSWIQKVAKLVQIKG